MKSSSRSAWLKRIIASRTTILTGLLVQSDARLAPIEGKGFPPAGKLWHVKQVPLITLRLYHCEVGRGKERVAKILVVEDETDVSMLLKLELQSENHVVEVAEDGNTAWELLSTYTYDVVVLDWQLPGMSGIEVCRKLRLTQSTTPVLMLTGRAAITDKTEGLDTGADDYLTKPFDIREVSARVRALLRRFGGQATNQVVVGDLLFDLKSKTLTVCGEPVKLLPKELALIEFLMRNPNEVFSPEALLERVWHSESQVSIGTVYTTIKTLRSKLAEKKADCPIETVHGMGYRLLKSD